jgi:nucleoside-diphosphate-sugar epimerase
MYTNSKQTVLYYSTMQSKKVLVAGGSGFVGRNLIEQLRKTHKVFSISNSTKVEGVENIIEDLANSDFKFLKKIKPDFIVWLATVSSPKEAKMFPQKCFDTNVTIIQKLLENSKQINPKKIVLLSSVVLYKDKKEGKYKEDDEIQTNSSIYNYSKYLMETLADYYRNQSELNITVFRLSNTYGPYQTTKKVPYLVPSLFEKAENENKIEVWNSKPVRDWVYVGDVAKAIEIEFGKKDCGTFNLGTGVGTSVGELTETIAKSYGKKVVDLKKDVAPPYRIVVDTKLIKKHLNFVPDTSLKVGIKKTLSYYDNV